MSRRALLVLLLVGSAPGSAGENLAVNGDFEAGLAGWHPLWTREPKAGKTTLDAETRHGGKQAVRVEHTGAQDWSLAHERVLNVEPGQIYELKGWTRLQGEGRVELSVILRDAKGRVMDWSFGAAAARVGADWRLARSRFIIPPVAATIQLRLIGHGPATVWLDDASLTLEGTMDALRAKDLPATLKASSAALEVTLHTADARLSAADRRTGQVWDQRPKTGGLVVRDAKAVAGGFDLRLLDPASLLEIAATVRLDPSRSELVLTLKGKGEMAGTLAFPPPFATAKGQLLILPVNEGISYPADDATLPPMHYHLYGGHGLCMPWYGQTDGERGLMAIVETADDAAVRLPRLDGLLHLAPEWQPQKGQFGPPRVIRYVFFDQGGYVAMAKRYRDHAKQTGLLKTLDEKRKANPNVDLLIGAANVWCWEKDAPAIARELQAAGIRRILWSNGRPPDQLKALNEMSGVLTSRYDIYQDTMDPAQFPKLRWVHGDWTSEAWANGDLMRGPGGEWLKGWEVEAKDGGMIPCGVLCDLRAPDYARKRIPAELKTHPYRCRFIDTTTASPWRECYDPKHPCTRTESKRAKMELLRVVSEECGLVCGSETGHDAAVPFVHYFEGMLSLGPYRVPDSGRAMQKLWDSVPEPVAKFQTGHFYRLPLWELVYHDCVVAQWYWGDYNNKLPSLWDRRDLWNALYGTPPMFMFDRKLWEASRDRFVRSYKTIEPTARATGYSEMLSHRWLTPDHAVQETRFANGVVVTANFGDKPFVLANGTMLAPLALHAAGVASEPQ
ncbi:MAG TPA: glycoside hydrolase [Planctomycetota bacterium]|mgnify:FL=1|nr:glycoside hydrolase [Planctomycetota bacterium]HRR79065.1 glycoside hydrolase [Planctomycetota bacterium]HRT93015.1 glycoside hydrolase [Planctomycetota bacterium]